MCSNTKGSYNCTGKLGYYGDGLMCEGKIFPVGVIWWHSSRADPI